MPRTTHPALSVPEPSASLIVAGAKRFEFRSWRPPTALIGKRLAIHVSARLMKPGEIDALLDVLRRDGGLRMGMVRAPAIALLEAMQAQHVLPNYSAVLGFVTLGQPVSRQALAFQLGVPPAVFSGPGQQWAWELTDARRLETMQLARGQQGVWDWETDLQPVELVCA